MMHSQENQSQAQPQLQPQLQPQPQQHRPLLFSMPEENNSNVRNIGGTRKKKTRKQTVERSNSLSFDTTTTDGSSCNSRCRDNSRGSGYASSCSGGGDHDNNGDDGGRSVCSSSVASVRSTYSNATSSSQRSTLSSTLQWWQRCTIRQSVTFLEQDIQHVISESPFLQQKQKQRQSCLNYSNETKFPLFHRSEIIIGELLGIGGFSNVYEIIGFELDERMDERLTVQQQKLRIETASRAIDPITGRGRYAIKHLQESLITKKGCGKREFELAASDLAVEIAYLSELEHPNILAVRGLPYRGIYSFSDGQYDSYFVIFDRLHDTLEDRINNEWKVQRENKVPSIVKKLNYAYQLADALQYLHSKRIVFRDLKPQNIGFDVNNSDHVVLFDFGLCREMPVSYRYDENDTDDNASSNVIQEHNDDYDNSNLNNTYEMSGVGTRRYMAPEVVIQSKYNVKADVYSWSMVFWEILTHTKPYSLYTFDEHRRIVCCPDGERPVLDATEWPVSVQCLLIDSWNENVQERLSMKQIREILQQILLEEQESTFYHEDDVCNYDKKLAKTDANGREIVQYNDQMHVVQPITLTVSDLIAKHEMVQLSNQCRSPPSPSSVFCMSRCIENTITATNVISLSLSLASSQSSILSSSSSFRLRYASNPEWLASLADDVSDESFDDNFSYQSEIINDREMAFTVDDGVEVQLTF